jgi:hypothetical protein
MVCYQNGCIKEKAQALAPMRVSDVTFCLQVLADQPLSIAVEHARITSTDIVEALQQQADEMLRIDDAIPCVEVVDVINGFEQRVRAKMPDVKWQFVEPDSEA